MTPSSSSSSSDLPVQQEQENHDEQQQQQQLLKRDEVHEEVVEVVQEEKNDQLTVTITTSSSWSQEDNNNTNKKMKEDQYTPKMEDDVELARAEAEAAASAVAQALEDGARVAAATTTVQEANHNKALLDDTTFGDDEDEEDDDDELEEEEVNDENHLPDLEVISLPPVPATVRMPTRPRPTLRIPPSPPTAAAPKPKAKPKPPPPPPPPSCPVFEASLLCGTSYAYTPLCEKMTTATVMTTAEFEYQQARRHQQEYLQQHLEQQQNIDHDAEEEKEMVSALPLFFITRFRTLDAERMALAVLSSSSSSGDEAELGIPPPPPPAVTKAPSEPDWYDMFAWLAVTMGSTAASPTSSSGSSEEGDSPTASAIPKLKLSPWNGHLPLGPECPTPTYTNSSSAKARRIQRKRLRQQQQQQQQQRGTSGASSSFWDSKATPPSPTSSSLLGSSSSSLLGSSSSLSPPSTPQNQPQHHNFNAAVDDEKKDETTPPPRSQTPLQVLRPLPIIPVNRPGQEDWEMVFLSNDDTSPSSSDSKGKHSARRAPTATTSMSIPAGVSPGGSKSDKHSSKHKSSKSSSSSSGGNGSGGMDLDTIAVRTPGADRSALKELPALRDAPPTKREELFILKLKLCSVIFSFDDPTADKRGKDMKRQTLLELVDYVNTPAGQKIFTESVMSDLMAMVSANVCRALPPATDDFDPEEDEPVLEPAWPHLQVAYEFFLRFIVSSEVNAKAAKKYVDQKFCLQLVELFDSEDPRERDYLKTILHRIYGKFMSHRSFIRRAISNVFYRFVYETERHNGIGELLEILGSIINGFAIPLKKEHLQFLVRALIPLHKPKCVALYHQQLSYCIIQYVEKDADTATPILNGFFKCWPWSSSAKQVMFLNELEEILELLGADQLAQVSTMLFTNLARCLDSDHFQVVERALFLWNNEHLVNSGCLSRLNAQTVLPIIYRPLYKNSAGHWNATVEGLAQNVLKMYMEYDLVLYDKCAKAYYREEEEAKRKLEALEAQWSAVEQTAAQNMPALMAK